MNYVIQTKVVSLEEKHQLLRATKSGKKLDDGSAEIVSESVSLGWFVGFEGSWEGICLGQEKPTNLVVGQEVDVVIRPRAPK